MTFLNFIHASSWRASPWRMRTAAGANSTDAPDCVDFRVLYNRSHERRRAREHPGKHSSVQSEPAGKGHTEKDGDDARCGIGSKTIAGERMALSTFACAVAPIRRMDPKATQGSKAMICVYFPPYR